MHKPNAQNLLFSICFNEFQEDSIKKKKKIPPGIHDKGRIKYHEISVQKKKKKSQNKANANTHTHKIDISPLK